MTCMSVKCGTENCLPMRSAFSATTSHTATSVAFATCFIPSSSECRFAMRPQPTNANLRGPEELPFSKNLLLSTQCGNEFGHPDREQHHADSENAAEYRTQHEQHQPFRPYLV